MPVSDRLARVYAYQVLVLDELARFGVEVHFTDNNVGRGRPSAPEHDRTGTPNRTATTSPAQ